MGMVSAYDRYRRRCVAEEDCKMKLNNHFITSHVSATTIYVVRTELSVDSVVLFGHEEGFDNAKVFTTLEEDLGTGDYFIWNNRYFFVTEEILTSTNLGYRKQRAVECNAITTENVRIAFLGNMRHYKDIALQKSYVNSGTSPVVIAPYNLIPLDSEIGIGDFNWRVIDGDTISVPGISFLYVERIPRDTTIQPEWVDKPKKVLYAGEHRTFAVDGGVLSGDIPLKIVERTANSATIEVPFGIDSLTLSYKVDGEDKIKAFEVKGG